MTNMCLKNAVPDSPSTLSITQQHDFLQAYLPLDQVVTRRVLCLEAKHRAVLVLTV